MSRSIQVGIQTIYATYYAVGLTVLGYNEKMFYSPHGDETVCLVEIPSDKPLDRKEYKVEFPFISWELGHSVDPTNHLYTVGDALSEGDLTVHNEEVWDYVHKYLPTHPDLRIINNISGHHVAYKTPLQYGHPLIMSLPILVHLHWDVDSYTGECDCEDEFVGIIDFSRLDTILEREDEGDTI